MPQQTRRGFDPVKRGIAGDPARYIGALPIAEAVGCALVPGLVFEAAGPATHDAAAEPYARAIGALAAGPAVATGRRVVTPLPANPARLAMVDTLRSEGVTDLTAGQITGSKKLQAVEGALSEVPLGSGRLADLDASQKRQFTRAAMTRMGSDADSAAPANFAPARDAIGNTFDVLSARNNITVDGQLHNDLYGAASTYLGNSLGVVPADKSDMPLSLVGTITRVPNGVLPGTVYQNTRSALSKLADAHAVNDPPFAQALRESRDALDETMTRSVSPDDAEAWATARRQYGNSKVIEKAASGGGEAAAAGNISPPALRTAAAAGRRGGYAAGSGDLDASARAGSGVMTAFPNSGTAVRSNVMAILRGAGTAAGAAAGAGAGGITGAALAAPVAAAVGPAVASHVVSNPLVQRYLANQVLRPAQPVTGADILGILAMRANGVAASTGQQ